MTSGKTIALTRWTFVAKVISLLFNMLSRLVIAFLPRSKCLLISWLQSPYAVIFGAQEIKSVSVAIVSPCICHEVMGLDAMILVSEYWVLSQLFHSPHSLPSWSSLVLLWFLLWWGCHLSIFEVIHISPLLIPACASSSPHFSWCTLHRS